MTGPIRFHVHYAKQVMCANMEHNVCYRVSSVCGCSLKLEYCRNFSILTGLSVSYHIRPHAAICGVPTIELVWSLTGHQWVARLGNMYQYHGVHTNRVAAVISDWPGGSNEAG